jgi:hypothetical protein
MKSSMKIPALVGTAGFITLLTSAALVAQQAAPGGSGRAWTATETRPLELGEATEYVGPRHVTFTIDGDTRIITGNGLTEHLVGEFPNSENPNTISAVDVSYEMPVTGSLANQITSAQGWDWGVSLEGIKFDPFAGEFWQGDPRSGWNYDALGNAVTLGLDANYAHVQPTGHYHYHGIPFGLLELARYDASEHSPLVGYAADGYPIYALTGIINGALTEVSSSYQLKDGERPGGDEPSGAYDGAFVQDYEYVEGSGTLDECNGAMTQSKEYPNGTYAYFLTTEYPVVPRCFTGTPDPSFLHGRR